MNKKIAVFPGSFSPFTKGHESIVLRALPLFDEIIISIGINPSKNEYFSLEERVKWIETIFSQEKKVKVMKYEGLTIDHCFSVHTFRSKSYFHFIFFIHPNSPLFVLIDISFF